MPDYDSLPVVKEDTIQELMDVELDLLKRDRQAHKDERLPVWFLGVRRKIDACEQLVKDEYKRLRAQAEAQRRNLELEWGQQFREAVAEDLKQAGGKRKLFSYATGQAGMRKSPDAVVVVDEEKAIEWAFEHCPDAIEIKIARTGPILEHLKKNTSVDPSTGEEVMPDLPGIRFVRGGDKPSPKLPHLEQREALEAAELERKALPPAENPGDIADPATAARKIRDPF